MKSEVYRKKKVGTRDELLVNILDVIACIKERQDALKQHELQSTLMLTVKFSSICYKLYQLCHFNNKYRY